jgi:bacterioferritin-associated ferredoxin
VLLLAGLISTTEAAEVESNCGMCHQQAPVPDGHPPVAEVSARSCGMCHRPTPEDGYFSAVHTAHTGVGLDCSSCHGAAADEALQQQLNSQLGK